MGRIAPKVRVLPPRIATLDTRAVRPPPKTAAAIYTTPEWRALMARLIRERGRRCEECGRTHDEGKPVRIFGDHIRELRDGGAPFDPGNVRLLDGRCHTRKTIRERARRAAERF
jgi:5-methylcytosine-specific restriction enzyme A